MRHFDTLTVIGIGLLGGSLGLAAKRRGLVRRVIGVARTENTLQTALERGCADDVTPNMVAAVADADAVVVATPVGSVADAFARISDALKPSALVTDVSSTKASICEAADACFAGRVAFVGGHPMAGDDRTGVVNAREHLFDGCTWALTPSAASTPEAVSRLAAFAQALGATVIELDPGAHDRAVAATSHLPHVAAAAVVNAVWEATGGDSAACQLTASGFRDTTRVAAGPAELWDDIVLDNAEALVPALDALVEELASLREAVAGKQESAIHAFLEEARRRRTKLLGERDT